MAHLVDGVVSAPVLLAATAVAVVGIGYGLRKIEGERIPHVGVMSATFFVASLVHVPVGPSSAHLLLNGLMGMVLGWAAVPAIFVALLLQAVFFGFGGITVLGVNTVNLAVPALLSFYLFGRAAAGSKPFLWGAVAGGFAVCATCMLVGLTLALSGTAFIPAAKLIFAAHLPIAVVEAFITGCMVMFLQRVKPEVLSFSLRPQAS